MSPQIGLTPGSKRAEARKMSSTIREQRYRICLDFLETAENKRRWNIFNDIPWDKLDASKATDEVVQRVEIFCAEEMYVPDYSSKRTCPDAREFWTEMVPDSLGL
jgi:hypothetical protein